MRGSNKRPKRLLSKRKNLSLLELPIESETITNGSQPGRPAGSIGLKRALIQEHCGDNPSRTALELIGAYCKLDEMRKEELKPRDLLGILASQKGILKMLSDLKQGPKTTSNGSSSYSDMNMDDLIEQQDEYAHLLGQSHHHALNGSLVECQPDGSGHVHVDPHVELEPKPRRRLNREMEN
jgi:hypothetical protein